MSLIGKKPSNTFKDLLYCSNSNSGLNATPNNVLSGNGNTSSAYLSTDKFKVQPSTDSTTNTVIYDADGNPLLTVDSSNDTVKTGINQNHTNTQYAYFGMDNTGTAGFSANNHYALNFMTGYNASGGGALVTLGTSTNPDTSYTSTATGMVIANTVWYVPDAITVDAVSFWIGSDASSGDTVRCHLMSYDIVTTAGATSGDLSNGVVIADGADISSDGYEQAYYQSMTVQSSSISAGKALFFTLRQDGVNSDYTITATIKYHLA